MRTFTTAAAVVALMSLSPAAFAADATQTESKVEQKAENAGAAVEQKADKAAEEIKQEGQQAKEEVTQEAEQADAEAPPPPADPQQGETAAVTDTSDMTDVVGMDVIGQDGEKVGEISDVLVGKDGMMQSIVVNQGGFLGIGEKSIALELSAVDIQDDGVHVNMTNDQLSQLPEWEPEPTEPQQPETAQMPAGGAGTPTGGATGGSTMGGTGGAGGTGAAQ
ncbi:MAG: PRC-barrel domain-containing protein [Caenispirillum sp.]|nr:PRC-barrel domain-containing protein [Caenispirillum sp.]